MASISELLIHVNYDTPGINITEDEVNHPEKLSKERVLEIYPILLKYIDPKAFKYCPVCPTCQKLTR